jgi:hypothetical protein
MKLCHLEIKNVQLHQNCNNQESEIDNQEYNGVKFVGVEARKGQYDE